MPYKHIFLTKRGNDAIYKALQIGKKLGFSEVYIADQGGWLTYRHFPKRLKLKLTEIRSDYGIVNESDLITIKDSIILLNASPAYAAIQPLDKIKKICTKNNNLLIADITATLDSKENADIIVFSAAFEFQFIDYCVIIYMILFQMHHLSHKKELK